MKWLQNFQFFLFDFDGLLVDTEYLHYQASCIVLKKKGYELDWTFDQFYEEISNHPREALFVKFPDLRFKENVWKSLKKEKQKVYFDLLQNSKIKLMPGADELLRKLHGEKKGSCVVTNSIKKHVDFIRKKLPILNIIPHWLTRETYERPKPDPECYLKAIKFYSKEGDKIIGFEDTIKGVKALSGTCAFPILVSVYRCLPLEKKVLYFTSLKEVLKASF